MMNKNRCQKVLVAIFLLITGQGIVFAKINFPIMVKNSPYSHGIADSCGGCVVGQQACLSGSCVSTADAASCFNGSSYTTCGQGTCGGTANLPYGQGNVTMTGICACSNGIINDNNNCGSCGNACSGSTAYCSFGQCVETLRKRWDPSLVVDLR